MSIEANKENIQRHVDEIWHAGNMDVVDELIAPNYALHSPDGNDGHGPDAFKQLVSQSKFAMPDLHWEIDNMIGEGDYLSVQYTYSGTFTGKMGDIEPTGKSLSQQTVVIYRFENGKQVEAWSYRDNLSAYRKLGIPIPA